MTDTPTIYTNQNALAAAVVELLETKGIGSTQPRLWNKAECADFLRCTTVHVDTLIKSRALPFLDISKPGSKTRELRFLPSAVVAWAGGEK